MSDLIRTYTNRLKRYDNIDGTAEMLMGLMWLAFAASSYLDAILPKTRWWNGIGGGLLAPAILVLVLGPGYWIRRIIKKRITWPRTGYAAYPSGGKSWRIKMVTVCLICTVVSSGFVVLMIFASRHGGMNIFQMGYLTIMLAAYVYWVSFVGKGHWWKWLLVVFMALGFLTIALVVPGDFIELARPAMLFVGLVWLASGGLTLHFYIRHTQPPALEAE
jgi:hypothetical protein